MIFLLFITIAILMVLSYLIFSADLISPSFVLCFCYMISILAVIINIYYWNVNFHINSYSVIVLGLISFIIVELIYYLAYSKNIDISKFNNIQNYRENIKSSPISISRLKFMLVLGFQAVTMILFFKEVYRVSLFAGNRGGYATMMSYYNYAINYMNLSANQRPNFVISQMYSLSLACAYIVFFIFIKNIICTKKIKLVYLLSPAFFIITSFLTGSRSGISNFIIYAIILTYILYHQNSGWIKRKNVKFVICIIVIAIAFMFVFVGIKQVVGRTDTTNAWNYITGYVGGSIQLFDTYMQNPSIGNNMPIGSETFFAIYNFLSKYGITSNNVYRNLPFISLAGTPFNVYTAFRRYMHDFGIIGVILLQMGMSAFYSRYYYRIKKYSNSYYNDFKIVLYGMVFFPIVFHSFDDMFYSSLLSFGFVLQLIYFYFVYRILVPRKVFIMLESKCKHSKKIMR